jgi:hypothetical protein
LQPRSHNVHILNTISLLQFCEGVMVHCSFAGKPCPLFPAPRRRRPFPQT